MRGTPASKPSRVAPYGIIPAYAGNTTVFPNASAMLRDHPRVCGEHVSRYSTCSASSGSSPRMRGTLVLNISFFLSTGIIPAYAGNTRISCNACMIFRDHPRVCGEHTVIEENGDPTWGSSPRMRGTQHPRVSFRQSGGIIPAYAGNTIVAQLKKYAWRDHPRVCGEHFMLVFDVGFHWGSSPRMRGTLR